MALTIREHIKRIRVNVKKIIAREDYTPPVSEDLDVVDAYIIRDTKIKEALANYIKDCPLRCYLTRADDCKKCDDVEENARDCWIEYATKLVKESSEWRSRHGANTKQVEEDEKQSCPG